jgi:4-hydroxybenzoate polyprenyltransferase
MYSLNAKGFIPINIFKLLKNELLYGAHLISLVSPSFIIFVSILLSLEINILSLIVAYLIPLIVYTYNYYGEIDKDKLINPEKAAYLEKRKKLFPHIVYFYIVLLILLLLVLQNIGFISFILIILVGGLLYTIVFKILTKSIPGFKSIYTAMIWAYAGTFYSIFFYDLKFNYIYVIIFMFILIKSVINVVYFDIKDIEMDKRDGLKTIPIIMGKKNTLTLLNALNVISLFIIFYAIYNNVLPFYCISLALVFLYTFYYLEKGKTSNYKELFKYTYIMADAEFLFWPIVILFGKILFGG